MKRVAGTRTVVLEVFVRGSAAGGCAAGGSAAGGCAAGGCAAGATAGRWEE
jgi:hypothetical protein